MKKFILCAICLGIFLNSEAQSTADALLPVDRIVQEIEHTKQTLSLLEGYLVEKQGERQDLIIDYRHRGVCGVKSFFTLHYSEVLGDLSEKINAQTTDRPVIVSLAENYLEDEEMQKIVEFIMSSDYIKKNLVEFDISNNRLKKQGVLSLKNLIEHCPRLDRLNVAINYVSTSEFNEIFGSLPSIQKSKVRFSVY